MQTVSAETLVPVRVRWNNGSGDSSPTLDENGGAAEVDTKKLMTMREYIQLRDSDDGHSSKIGNAKAADFYLKDWHSQAWLDTARK